MSVLLGDEFSTLQKMTGEQMKDYFYAYDQNEHNRVTNALAALAASG